MQTHKKSRMAAVRLDSGTPIPCRRKTRDRHMVNRNQGARQHAYSTAFFSAAPAEK